MIPIISIVGRSGSGKTLLIERLIPELKSRGYRIATIKHDIHDFEIDYEGKDSFRHKKAGAVISVISSPKKVALVADLEEELSLDELRNKLIKDVDLIITEGYGREKYPKIEVFRKNLHPEPLCKISDNLIAIVSDEPLETDIPSFSTVEIKKLTDFIEERFLKE